MIFENWILSPVIDKYKDCEDGTSPDGTFHHVSRFHDEVIQELLMAAEERGEYF